MKHRTLTVWIALLSLLLFAGAAFAQQQPAPTGPAAAAPAPIDRSGLTGSLYRLSTLRNLPIVQIEGVQAPQTEVAPGAPGAPADTPADGTAAPGMATTPAVWTFGRVDDAIISADGQVSHLLVDIDDVEGVEGGLYLVQMDQADIQDSGITLNASPQDLTTVEDEENAAEQAGADSHLASTIMDFPIVGSDDEEIGGIDDLVVDIEQARVVYAAMGRGGILGIGQSLHAISFDSITFEPEEERARIDATEDDYEDVEGFPGDEWPSSAPGQS